MGTSRTPSKAEIRRRITAATTTVAPPRLSAEHEAILADYEPRTLDPVAWAAAKPFVIDTLRRHPARGDEAFRQRLVALIKFCAWAQDMGHDLDAPALFTERMIEGFVNGTDISARTAANYRSRLRGMAAVINPLAVSTASTKVAHRSVKAPYTDREVAIIVRVASVQPSPRIEQQLCAGVGLGLGAGLDARDIRPLHGRHVTDHGPVGIEIDVPGPAPRHVWVLAQYDGLVRRGVAGVRPNELLIGRDGDRRNVTANLYWNLVAEGSDMPRLEQGRLRTTWIATLLRNGVTLPVLMDAAGLISARTVTDVVAMLPEADAATDERTALRGGGRR